MGARLAVTMQPGCVKLTDYGRRAPPVRQTADTLHDQRTKLIMLTCVGVAAHGLRVQPVGLAEAFDIMRLAPIADPPQLPPHAN